MYLLAKKVVESYESKQLNIPVVMGSKKLCLNPVAVKEIGKRYYWDRNPLGGKKGNVTIISEGGSSRTKGWQVLYGNETEGTKFADDNELYEALVE